MKILVTGALGFIGSHLVKKLIEAGHKVTGFDRLSDTSKRSRISLNFRLINGDLNDMSNICEGMDVVFHLAADTFVDHSIRDPQRFVRDNVLGTAKLLEDAIANHVFRFFQISTDEVYGERIDGKWTENAPLNPRNPYAATKAAADCLVLSYANTYGLNAVITRCENNYGRWQHRQKMIPAFVSAILAGQPIPIYGDGQHVRSWLHVNDHCDALIAILDTTFDKGEIFHISSDSERTNEWMAKEIIKYSGQHAMLGYVPDRPGHDKRYALDSTKLRSRSGWSPRISIDQGLEDTVNWFMENKWWL
jgi:dTDP-glucose 4,6-dehydratase